MLGLADRTYKVEGLLPGCGRHTVRHIEQEHHVGALRHLRQTETHEASYHQGKHHDAHPHEQVSSAWGETARSMAQPVPAQQPKDQKERKIGVKNTYLHGQLISAGSRACYTLPVLLLPWL